MPYLHCGIASKQCWCNKLRVSWQVEDDRLLFAVFSSIAFALGITLWDEKSVVECDLEACRGVRLKLPGFDIVGGCVHQDWMAAFSVNSRSDLSVSGNSKFDHSLNARLASKLRVKRD